MFEKIEKMAAETRDMARAGLAESLRHNKAVESQNEQILALLRQLLEKK